MIFVAWWAWCYSRVVTHPYLKYFPRKSRNAFQSAVGRRVAAGVVVPAEIAVDDAACPTAAGR